MTTQLTDDLSKLLEDNFITAYLTKNRSLLVTGINLELKQLTLIDLDLLPKTPINFPEVLLRWLVHVNKPRLENGEEPLMTFDVIKHCPIWKIVKLPMRTIKADRGTLNKPLPTISSQKSMGTIGGFNSNQKRKKKKK